MRKLDCSVVLSTYQAGKLVIISAVDDTRLVQLPRTFSRAMAIGTHENKLAVATMDTVEVYANDPRLAPNYPNQPNTYDGLYAPRITYQTGRIDCHGLNWDADGRLWAVNTQFGCLATLSDRFSFEPQWQPPFVTELVPEDRAHLNGVAFQDGNPKYVTCLATTNEAGGWRKQIPDSGVLIDVETNEILLRDLPMPHSPRLVGDTLYMLLSATGQLVRANLDKGTYDVVQDLSGFVRGLEYYRDHLFVGLSKLRKNSSTFRDLPIAEKALFAGVSIIHEPTGAHVGQIRYQQTVDEIFDVSVLGGFLRPGIVSLEKEARANAVTSPEKTWWAKPPAHEAQGRPQAAPAGPQAGN
jgi:uncharacterized protein (TIGR03032 family)